MKWATNLQLVDMDYEVDSKKVVDSICGGKDRVSDFGAIISDCGRLLGVELANSIMKFIRRQTNGVAHYFAREVPLFASFCIFSNMYSDYWTKRNALSLFISKKKKMFLISYIFIIS